ncbi:unnamed protein product [Diatraea saccharalis]|uniref:Uncharacterized protein n=1 Tax=Diatraea saccharalis TaxID=40085 RepID=A0A9P0FZC2_9NEOP|nr:unnamed protein product [Diatraea saccharalis]
MRFRKTRQCYTRRQFNMSRTSILVLLLCVVAFASKSVNSSLILPKDVKVENVATSEIPQNEISKDKVEDVNVEVNKPTETKCVKIGEFVSTVFIIMRSI